MSRGPLRSHSEQLFDPPTDLKRRASKAGRFTAAGQVFGALLGFGSMAVLSRLLSPDDYGLVAMVTVVTAFMANFADAGLTSSVIFHERLTHQQVSNLFWINLVLGIVLAAVVAALSPLLAGFYDRPEVGPVCLGCACSFIPIALGVQHGAILRRRLEFGKLAITAHGSVAIGVVAAVTIAAMGGQYWALVAQINVMHWSRTVLSWAFTRWRPALPTRAAGTRPLVAFGGLATIDEVVRYFGRNVEQLAIGRILGASSLGLYFRAGSLFGQVPLQLTGPFGSVAIPALSRVQSEPERFVSAYRLGLALVASVALPSIAFMFVYAEPLIELLMGARWLDCLPIYRLMLGEIIAFSIGGCAVGWLFMYQRRLREQVKVTALSAGSRCLCVLVSIPLGLEVCTAALSVTSLVMMVVGFVYGSRGSPVRLSDATGALAMPFAASMIAGFVGFLTLEVLPESIPAGMLVIAGGLIFSTAYFIAWVATGRGRKTGSVILATIKGGGRSR